MFATSAVADAPRRNLLWGFTSLAAGQLTAMALGVVGFAYLARTLPPSSYGLVEYAVGLTAIGTIVVESGLGPVGVLEIAKDRSRAAAIATSIARTRLLLALLVVPLIGFSTLVTDIGEAAALIWLYALALFTVPLKQDWLLQALDKMPRVAPAQALRSGVFAAGVVLLVGGVDDLLTIGAIEIAAASAAALYFLASARAIGLRRHPPSPPFDAWSLVRSGAGLGASNIVWTFLLYAPILIVTNIAGAQEAAWLGGAQRIVYSLVAFSALYFFNLYPAIARGVIGDRALWAHLIGSSFRVMGWVSLGTALVATILADVILVAVFGAGFQAAAPVFALYIWLFPVRLLAGHARWSLVAAGRQRYLLLSELGGGLMLVPTAPALAAGYGALGVALAVLAANLTSWVLAEVFAARHVGRLPWVQGALVPAGSAAASLLLALASGGSPLLRVIIAGACFAVCARLFASTLLIDARRLLRAER
jgi:O-antigen/teichoic acid export membrane protein